MAGARHPGDVTSFLPLRPLELLVLAMLAEAELHGYAIRQAIVEHTRGSIEVEAGNLYRHIRRLDAGLLIEESGRRPARDQDDERRRYYRLTPLGRRVLAAELARLRELVRWGEKQRLIPVRP
jgi:DNA-binding PadR family transcriptional regulator